MESLGKSWENTKSQMTFILLSIYKRYFLSMVSLLKAKLANLFI